MLIAAPQFLPALTARAAAMGGDVLAFPDADVLRALEQIITRRPQRVALEQSFAGTSRGAALINRIKADPALIDADLRIIHHDADRSGDLPLPPATAPSPGSDPSVAPATEAAAALDEHGTRRIARVPIAERIDITIDGNPATLIDLSPLGAQVVSPTVLKPNQRIRLAIADEQGTLRLTGTIAWASFEIPPKSGPQYRAGIEFVRPDAAALGAFCQRHQD